MPLSPPADTVARFRRSLAEVFEDEPPAGLGVAVSGGPDSTALLLLAAAALPGRVEAATVDHRFRTESRGESDTVAALCQELGVPHEILTLDWSPPARNRQRLARERRYQVLAGWAADRGLAAVATAHHGDDQAETLLMRLHRGAGVGGLSGIRPTLLYAPSCSTTLRVVRPLLGWRKADLVAVPAALGVAVTDDPSNADPAHDRTGARAFLQASPNWPDRARLTASAAHLAEADAALDWSAGRLLDERARNTGDGWQIEVSDVPTELRLRLLLLLLNRMFGPSPPRGDRVARALRLLDGGRVATIAGVVIRPLGTVWHLALAPPRRPR